MATTVAFDLITRLVDVCRDAVPAGVEVYDGPGASNDAGDFLMVGVGDPDSQTMSESASGEQAWAGLGAKATYEEGTVTCCALSWSGDTGDDAQKAVRERVRDIVASVEAACKEDPNLGGVVAGLNWVRFGQNYNLSQLGGTTGVVAIFYFEIAYKARLV